MRVSFTVPSGGGCVCPGIPAQWYLRRRSLHHTNWSAIRKTSSRKAVNPQRLPTYFGSSTSDWTTSCLTMETARTRWPAHRIKVFNPIWFFILLILNPYIFIAVNKESNNLASPASSSSSQPNNSGVVGGGGGSSSSSALAAKPPYTYTELIEQALSEKGPLTVAEIYRWIS